MHITFIFIHPVTYIKQPFTQNILNSRNGGLSCNHWSGALNWSGPSQLPQVKVRLTWGQTDAVSILQLQPGALELAFPLLHVGLVSVQLENEDVELPLQDVDLSLCQLLLPPLQQLLLRLLLQGGSRQLLLPGAQLLQADALWEFCRSFCHFMKVASVQK